MSRFFFFFKHGFQFGNQWDVDTMKCTGMTVMLVIIDLQMCEFDSNLFGFFLVFFLICWLVICQIGWQWHGISGQKKYHSQRFGS